MKDYPEMFHEGYRVGSVYGTFPGAIWNGGRAVMGFSQKKDIISILDWYNSRQIPVRFTWTNALIEEKHLNDTYCNLIMKLADNGLNQVLVNAPVLEEYIRREYPKFKMISSTTKRIRDVEGLQKEIEQGYHLVVFDYDMNHNEEALTALEQKADKVEILVNEVCYPDCPKRTEHYLQQSRLQLEFDAATGFPCPNVSTPRNFEECTKRPAFIFKEEINDYIEKGFVNFKIVGRGLPMDFAKESYIYYLVKDEHKDFIREKMDGLLSQIYRNRRA